MENAAAEPRALSMSLDDIIKEKREKEGPQRWNSRGSRGGAHSSGRRTGGKQTHNHNKGDRVVRQQQNRTVRARYNWETAEGVESMTMQVDDKNLLKISSSGDVILYSSVDHDWTVFTPMNTCLAVVNLKIFFDGDIKKEWTVKNESGWNRVLDCDVTVSAFPTRQWTFTKRALQQLPEVISLQPKQPHVGSAGGRGGFHQKEHAMGGMSGPMGMQMPMMNPMMMMMMMAQQQQAAGGAMPPRPAPADSSESAGGQGGYLGGYSGGRGRGGWGGRGRGGRGRGRGYY